MLLAIADNANEYGEAWPAVGTLATKCRMSTRNAQVLLSKLDESGELVIGRQAGQPTPAGSTNLYTIVTPGAQRREGVKPVAPPTPQGVKPVAPVGVQSSVARGAIQRSEGVKPVAPKPSVNRQEPISPPPLTPPAPVLRLIPGGRRGGGEEEVKEIDDEGETDEGIDVLVDECEIESDQRSKAELVDQLVALGLWRSSAVEAVEAGTVATNHDIVCCKRFCESSRLENPAGSLWQHWLSTGHVPPIPQLTDTDPSVIDAARRLSADLDRQRDQAGGPMIDQRALDALKARQAGPVLKSFPTKKRAFEWVQP